MIRASGTAAAVCPWRFSTKYEDAETGLLYYGYRYLNPGTGRWLSREPLGELVSRNPYGFADNDGLNYFDFNGLEKGAQRQMSLSRSGGGGMSALTGLRNLLGLPFSLLSGDIFAKDNENFRSGVCRALIVVNGILNSRNDADQIMDDLLKSSLRYGGGQIDDSIASHNTTAGPLDLVQILGDELRLIQSASRQLAASINQAYESIKRCGKCCGNIQVFAHSQGGAVMKQALPMIKREAKTFICYTSIGSQTFIGPDNGFASPPENHINQNDFVPRMSPHNSYGPGAGSEIFTGPNTSGHSFANYRDYVNKLPANCPCVPFSKQ